MLVLGLQTPCPQLFNGLHRNEVYRGKLFKVEARPIGLIITSTTLYTQVKLSTFPKKSLSSVYLFCSVNLTVRDAEIGPSGIVKVYLRPTALLGNLERC